MSDHKHKDPRDHKDHLEHREHKGHLEHREHKSHLEHREHKGHLEHREHKVHTDHKGHTDHDPKEILFGLYDDEEVMMDAVRVANKKHLEIEDVFTPFPVHGLDHLLHLSESRLHIAGFVYGAMGTLTAFLFMTWVFTRDWPIIFGGKPYWSVPAFIPITFELTVLFSAIGMVVTYYVVNGQAPGAVIPTLHDRITDDKFCIAFKTNGASSQEVGKLKDFLSSTGASLIDTKIV